MTTVDNETLSLMSDEPSQLAFINQALAELGFEWFDYIQRQASPFTTPRYHHVGTIPDTLVRLGERHLIHEIATTTLMQQSSLLIWDSADFLPLFPEMATLPETPRYYGLFAPGINLLGNTAAVLTLARSSHPVTPQELESKRIPLHLVILAVQHLSQLILAARYRQAHAPDFNRRQLEILRWVADGKTNEDIGRILGISSYTVNYHTKQILEKTSKHNRHNAALSAFIAGLIP